ncbi:MULTISPECIES: DUF2934 domain-containing protein [Pseudomonas]|jgi:hypothetical protein|uniref:DUF2934 domain-containing protein n=1 Tax=Pseudomonas TaxID=286 RepID=UPI000C9BBD2F|nr:MULTISPECIES: DUF2934 domain-containing protein [Pseudomonas]MBV7570905.1 DUF2934 domain-containing protein [Pseudomonas sp. PDM27]PNB74009.1 hypothetical protein C1X64_11985 [Pseudomonas sp. GW456-E7]QXH59575.1 DUF2934 domain-containing protein [Pseudomonas azerbaijanorientalis]
MSTDDKRIREFAYQIWESEGKPEGQEARHWEMACKLAEAEALAPKKPAKAAASKTPVSKTANGKAGESKVAAPKTKAKPAAASKVIPPGEKAVEKKPRAPRKPPAV